MLLGTVADTVDGNATRRHVIAGVAATIVGLAASGSLSAGAQEAMKTVPSSAADRARTSLHQEIALNAGPQRIYAALMDSKQFAAFTGMPAMIDPKAGGSFSLFKGMIVGRNVELVGGRLIVQAWRPAYWEPGLYSMVRFVLKPHGSETNVVLDHTGFPQGDFAQLGLGWREHYWDRLSKYLALAG